MTLTKEQQRRIHECISDTNRILEKAKSYLDHNQDKKLIADYEAHRVKLLKMLDDGCVTH